MPIANLHDVLAPALSGGYAAPACNIVTWEALFVTVEEAERYKTPVILMLYPPHAPLFGAARFAQVARMLADEASVPVCIHYDHTDTKDEVIKRLEEGYTSIMFDGAHLPLEENIGYSRELVQLANQYDASIEGAIGISQEDGVSKVVPTGPEEAGRLAREAGVAAMAVSVGNVSGFYESEVRLDYERLRAIRDAAQIPLALHGGSGIPAGAVAKCIECGVAKVNVGTLFMDAFTKGVRSVFEREPDCFDPTIYLQSGRERVRECVREVIAIAKSEGAAGALEGIR